MHKYGENKMTRIMMATVLTSTPERDVRNMRAPAFVERNVPPRCTPDNTDQPNIRLPWQLLGTAVLLSQCNSSPHYLEPLPFRTALCTFCCILTALQHLLLLTLRATAVLPYLVLSHKLCLAAIVNVNKL